MDFSHGLKHSKRIFFFSKLISKKHFFCLNWNYLETIMMQMSFWVTWRKWIPCCLASSMMSMLVSGSPTEEFPTSRGVWQGDPLSPFLFILALEGLNVAVKSASKNSQIQGIKLPNRGPWSRTYSTSMKPSSWENGATKVWKPYLASSSVSTFLRAFRWIFLKSCLFEIGYPTRRSDVWKWF